MANLSIRTTKRSDSRLSLSTDVFLFAFDVQAIKGGFPMSATTLLSNSSGQVPMIPGLPGLIDKDTPQEAYTRTGFDGETYNLVFSDEVSFIDRFSQHSPAELHRSLNSHSLNKRDERSGLEMIRSGKLSM